MIHPLPLVYSPRGETGFQSSSDRTQRAKLEFPILVMGILLLLFEILGRQRVKLITKREREGRFVEIRENRLSPRCERE